MGKSRKHKIIQESTVPACNKVYDHEKSVNFVVKRTLTSTNSICFWTSFVVLYSFWLYVKTLHPSLPGGDSGELIVAAHELGVAHPPGYPLFTLLAKLFMTFIPWGSVAWRVNLLSASSAALCAGALFLVIYRLTGSVGAGILGSCVFASSRLVWTWSVCAEVFALNNLLLSMLLLTAVVFEMCEAKDLTLVCMCGAFISGLCLTNQHTSVLYIVIIVPWVFYRLWAGQNLTVQLFLRCALCFLLGLLPYIYLPVVSTARVARWTWGDQSSIWGFLVHLLRKEYGTLDLLKDHTGQGFMSGLRAYMEHAWVDLSPLVCILLAVSVLTLYLRWKRGLTTGLLTVCYVMLMLYLGVFCWRANLDINKPLFFKVVERFWLQSDLVICVLAAVSFGDLLSHVSKYVHTDLHMSGVALAVIAVAFQTNKWWSVCDQSNNWVVHDFAQQTLSAFPKDSIILTKGDLPSNSLRYLQFCENVRPDLTIYDQEVLTYAWSLPMTRKFYPKLVFPGDRWQPYSGQTPDGLRAFTFKDLIDANYRRYPIFVCIGVQEHEASWQSVYTLWPFGVCSKLMKKKEVLDVEEWAKVNGKMGQQWKYPLESVDDGSWEHVASAEMWRSRTAAAYFFLELGMKLPQHSQETTTLFLKAYEIYTRELSTQTASPAYWHRNYAIVCEHLSRMDTALDRLDLLRKTVQHFSRFLQLDPGDPDSGKIRRAVDSLQAYLDGIKT